MKKTYIIVTILVILFISTYYLICEKDIKEYEDIYLEENKIEEQIEKVTKIKIHIIGEVISPGMYELDEGARIFDAVRIAGGTTENSDTDKINLAYELSDGEKIYIPSIFDEENEYTLNDKEKTSNKININKASSEELQSINGIGPSLASKIIAYREENGKFNSVEELKNVSGIGDKKYESICEFIVVK